MISFKLIITQYLFTVVQKPKINELLQKLIGIMIFVNCQDYELLD